MDWKWLDRAYQFDGEPSGGGGDDPPPAPAPPDPTPPPAEPPPGPPPEPVGDGDTPVVDPATPPTPSGPVALPKGLGGLFSPPPATPPPGRPPEHWTPPAGGPAAPATPPAPEGPPEVAFPDGDDWLADPGKAAKQQAEAIAYSNWKANEPMREQLAELRSGVDNMKKGDFNAISQRVNAAMDKAEEVVTGMYHEAGPLNSDKEFRENPELQKSVENIIGVCIDTAIDKADRTGDTTSLENIINDPKFPYRCLAVAKADAENVPEGALRPGASPVGQQPAGAPRGDGLSEEDRAALAAARADGSPITAADIIKARKLTKKSIY